MKRKTLKTTESIHKWITGINSGILRPPSKTENQCPRCQLLQIENQRLEWLIANMMTNVEDVKEFEYAIKTSA